MRHQHGFTLAHHWLLIKVLLLLLLLLLRTLAQAVVEIHEVGAEFGSSRYFILVRHSEFGASCDFILMSCDKLMRVLCRLIHVLGARLILIVSSCSYLISGVGISAIVISLILLASVIIEAVVSTITLVVGLVIYILDVIS